MLVFHSFDLALVLNVLAFGRDQICLHLIFLFIVAISFSVEFFIFAGLVFIEFFFEELDHFVFFVDLDAAVFWELSIAFLFSLVGDAEFFPEFMDLSLLCSDDIMEVNDLIVLFHATLTVYNNNKISKSQMNDDDNDKFLIK